MLCHSESENLYKCICYINLHNIKISLQFNSYTSKDLKIILNKNKIYTQSHASSTSSVAWQPLKFGLGLPFGLLKIIIVTERNRQPHAPTPTWRSRLWFLGVFPQGGWQKPNNPTQPPCFETLFAGSSVETCQTWMTTSSYTTVPCNTA